MKRDMDLVRQILLEVEDKGSPALRHVPEIEGYEADLVTHHVGLLYSAGYVTAIDAKTYDGPDFMQIALSWSGHEFLDSIRDPEIWSKTKTGAGKVGSWSVSLIAELAKGYAKQKAAELGLPISL